MLHKIETSKKMTLKFQDSHNGCLNTIIDEQNFIKSEYLYYDSFFREGIIHWLFYDGDSLKSTTLIITFSMHGQNKLND